MSALLGKAALRYLDLGFSVIPVRANRKTGPPFRWQRWQRERPSPEQVRIWFENWNDGLAIITGRISNAIVLDLDCKQDANGQQAVKSLYGWEPEGPLARTGGGGLHAYYLHPGRPVKNKVALHPGVDVRGDGGFVYAPPSPHPSGRRYEWLVPPWDEELPEAPGWLLEAACEAQVAAAANLGADQFGQFLLQGVEEGTRNDSAARLAGHYLALGMSADEVLALLGSVWNPRNRPPLPEHELRRVVESIARREAIKRGEAIEVRGDDEDDRRMILQTLSERLGIRIDDIERVGGSDPFYRFHCNGEVVEIPATQIISQNIFRSRMVAATRRVPSLIGKKANPSWDHYCQLMLNVARDVDPGEEATRAGELREWVRSYLEACAPVLESDQESVNPDDPRVRDGQVYLHAQSFRRHVEAAFGAKLEHKKFCQRLRAEGFSGPEKLDVRLGSGQWTSRYMWPVPADFLPDGSVVVVGKEIKSKNTKRSYEATKLS